MDVKRSDSTDDALAHTLEDVYAFLNDPSRWSTAH